MTTRPEPRAFGPAARPLFGFLHRPPNDVPVRDTGVVICKPFGYEASTGRVSPRSKVPAHEVMLPCAASTQARMWLLRDSPSPTGLPAWVATLLSSDMAGEYGVRRVLW